jgi:3-deoxy-manno-octulosonate cytidylyltransferase (CMP-KDO synthetase)
MINCIAIIPARYTSTRFPGKPLAKICGKPMLWWVYQQVLKCKKISKIIIATDDELIADFCKENSFPYVMTSKDHMHSTSRAFEAAKKYPSDFYVVINGDEPLINPKAIDSAVPNKIGNNIYVSNVITRIKNPVEALDPTNIKVVFDINNHALMYTRSLVPYPKASLNYSFFKHVGIITYNYSALEFFVSTPKGYLESVEDINELRFIENGIKIKVIKCNIDTISVDTPKDILAVEERIRKNGMR